MYTNAHCVLFVAVLTALSLSIVFIQCFLQRCCGNDIKENAHNLTTTNCQSVNKCRLARRKWSAAIMMSAEKSSPWTLNFWSYKNLHMMYTAMMMNRNCSYECQINDAKIHVSKMFKTISSLQLEIQRSKRNSVGYWVISVNRLEFIQDKTPRVLLSKMIFHPNGYTRFVLETFPGKHPFFNISAPKEIAHWSLKPIYFRLNLKSNIAWSIRRYQEIRFTHTFSDFDIHICHLIPIGIYVHWTRIHIYSSGDTF